MTTYLSDDITRRDYAYSHSLRMALALRYLV